MKATHPPLHLWDGRRILPSRRARRRVRWTPAVTRGVGTVETSELQTHATERNVDAKHRPNIS